MKAPTRIRLLIVALLGGFASTSCLSADGKQADATYPSQLLGIWEGGVPTCVSPGKTDSDARIEITPDSLIDYEQWNEPKDLEQISESPLAWKVDSLLHIDEEAHEQHEVFILSGEDHGLLTIADQNQVANYVRCDHGQSEASESEHRDRHAPPADGASCSSLSDVDKREACSSKMSDSDIAECERLRPSSCTPYKDMHTLELELQRTSSEIEALSRSRYSTYIENDRAYLDDLAAYLRESDRTWRAYREADCLLEPFAQGMSRHESYDITESCRADKTRQRISELKRFVSLMRLE